METNITSIRCPGERQHGVYETCNHLLGAIEDGQIILFCAQCKQFYRLEIYDNDHVKMTPLDKNIKIKMKTKLKALDNV